ncbi:hypothetical protein [Flammeovirga pacifica]|nr:hypothetical protein [Flammeovirga pacifica]
MKARLLFFVIGLFFLVGVHHYLTEKQEVSNKEAKINYSSTYKSNQSTVE